MKKSEFKKILKPIVRECIQESLMEDGLISSIISEVVRGMAPAPRAPIVAGAPTEPDDQRLKQRAFSQQQTKKLQEHKSKLMAAVGGGAYNGVDLFAGTTPTSAQPSPRQQAEPLSDHAPNDPGVDIKSLFGAVGNHWDAHMSATKEVK